MDKRLALPLLLSLSHMDRVDVAPPARRKHWRDQQSEEDRQRALDAAAEKRARKNARRAAQEVGE